MSVDGKQKILREKELAKSLKEMLRLRAQLEANARELLPMVRRMEPGRRKDEALDLLRETAPHLIAEPKPPRASWGSQEWVAEAAHLKSAARKYRVGGRIDLAERNERDAQTALETGRTLRVEGK